MNTKQILHNALSAQLEIKKIEAEKYTNEVYNAASAELKNSVLEYFTNKIGGFSVFNFTGNNIRLEISSSYYDRIEISVNNSWRNDEKVDDIKLEWNSGNLTNKKGNDTEHNYLNTLNKVYSNFEQITDIYLNKWWPTYLSIEKDNSSAWKEHNELRDALKKLNDEIKRDSTEAMKQIGFEIKKFKIDTSLDWDYNSDSGRTYKILTRDKSIQLQHGRSMYDTIYATGFKVLGKKGNKYNVEVYRDGYDTRTYNVLEKKFHSFVESVSRWENIEADENKDSVEKRYAGYTK